jgi:large-conductance mechanosensitive channel
MTQKQDTPPPETKHSKVMAVLLDPDDIVRHQAAGFVGFLQEYAVVGLALGFIVGQQANGVVKQFVASFVNPMFEVWFGQDLSTRTATLHHGHKAILVPWGEFVFVLLEFFFVLFLMYVLIKSLGLSRFTKQAAKKAKGKK